MPARALRKVGVGGQLWDRRFTDRSPIAAELGDPGVYSVGHQYSARFPPQAALRCPPSDGFSWEERISDRAPACRAPRRKMPQSDAAGRVEKGWLDVPIPFDSGGQPRFETGGPTDGQPRW